MEASVRISIGAVRLVADGIRTDVLPPFYQPFFNAPDKAGDCFPVRVRTSDRVDDSGLIPLADNEPGFSWFRSGEAFVAAKRDPREPSELLWRVDMPPGADAADIEVRRSFVNPPPGVFPTCPLAYPVDQVLLMHHLATRHGAIHHSAGAVARGRLLLFPGRSRAGKTTITRLLMDNSPMELLSDDRIVSREIGGQWLGFGTPWPGEAGVARNAFAPLAGLFFLRQSTDVRIERLTPSAALDRLLPVTSILWFAPELFAPQVAYLHRLVESVPCHDLHFRKDPSSAEVLAQWIATNL